MRGEPCFRRAVASRERERRGRMSSQEKNAYAGMG